MTLDFGTLRARLRRSAAEALGVAWTGALRRFGRSPEPLPPLPPVFAGATYWTVNGVNIFSANLVRVLNQLGADARVLLTEEDTDLITILEKHMPRPDDIPFETLGLARSDGWGRHWGRLVRYLGERAPCIYVPNSDWRNSCVCPQLPNDVIVVGVVHSDDPLHYDHVRRLGHTWNAIVAVSRIVAERTAALCPSLADRIVTIPIGVPIPFRLPKKRTRSDRLRLIYHGVLKQHQKRVLDLPRIVQAAVDRGVPVEMTIAGAGPDQDALFDAAAGLVERGAMRFHGIATQAEIGTLLEKHDVYVLASEFEGMPNALIEAMGRGCVPLATQMKSGVPELVRDADNGFLVPIGDANAFAERLELLWRDQSLRRQMSIRAYQTVSDGGYRVEDMVRSYAAVFDRAHREMVSGRFVRQLGELNHPPAEVAGVSLFPLTLGHHEPGVGAFVSEYDALEYRQEIRRLETGRANPRRRARQQPGAVPVTGMKVFIACPIWVARGENEWAEDLARGLRLAGLDARLLLTEESTPLVTIPGPRLDRPADVPMEMLEPAGADGWGARWGTLTRLLESSAPCFYLPNYDWRHACVTPVLGRDVMVVGIVHAATGPYLEQARRLGPSWNAVVATNTLAARRTGQELRDLLDRLVMIPHGLIVPGPDLSAEGDPSAPVLVLIGPGGVTDADGLVAQVATSGIPVTVVLVDDPQGLLQEPRGVEGITVSRPNRQQWTRLCRASSVVVTTLDPAIERRVIEAMAHGCVPVVVDRAMETDAKGIVVDGHNGLRVRGGTADVVAAVRRIRSEQGLHAALRQRARAAGAEHYNTDQMVASFVDLFSRIRADVLGGVTPDRSGRVEMPPQSVDGIDILPIPRDFDTPVGRFPSETDAERFQAERTPKLDGPGAGLPTSTVPESRGVMRVLNQMRRIRS